MQEIFRGCLVIGGGATTGAGTGQHAITLGAITLGVITLFEMGGPRIYWVPSWILVASFDSVIVFFFFFLTLTAWLLLAWVLAASVLGSGLIWSVYYGFDWNVIGKYMGLNRRWLETFLLGLAHSGHVWRTGRMCDERNAPLVEYGTCFFLSSRDLWPLSRPTCVELK
jgi:hypothetical protein